MGGPTNSKGWSVFLPPHKGWKVCVAYACVRTIIVCVLPLLVTPYANMVPLMPSIEDCTTLSLVLA